MEGSSRATHEDLFLSKMFGLDFPTTPRRRQLNKFLHDAIVVEGNRNKY